MTKCKFAIHCPRTLAVVMTENIMVRAKQFRYYNSITGWACIILMKKLIRGDWKKIRPNRLRQMFCINHGIKKSRFYVCLS